MVDSLEQIERLLHRIAIVAHPYRRCDAVTAIDVADFSDGVHSDAGACQAVEDARRRLDRVVAPIRRSREGTRHAHERPSDHPVHVVRLNQHCSSSLAPLVQRRERYYLLVSRDLEYRVGRGVEYRPAGCDMFGPEPLDDLGPRCGHVAQWRLSGDPRELLNDLMRKAVGIGGEWHHGNDSRHLPMAGDRVFSAAAFAQSGDARGRPLGC